MSENPFEMTATEGLRTENAPAGAHAAVLVGLIDLGTHTETYKESGKPDRTSDVRKVLFVWELPGKKMSGMKDANHLTSKVYNLSFAESSGLRKLVEAWGKKKIPAGEKFNIAKLLGYHCLLTLVEATSKNTGKTYTKISGVAPLPDEMGKPKAQRKPMQWLIDGDPKEIEWVPYIFGEKAGDYVARSKERKAAAQQAPVGAGTADDDDSNEIPF